jgi:Glycosyltransferase family 87
VSGSPVTTSATGSPSAKARPPAGAGRRWRLSVNSVIIVATAVAIGLRLYELSRPGYLFSVTEYDDGTDFGSAIRLIHGAMPYRDFVMVQPPGITLLMAPVALATKALSTATAMATGRVLTSLASAAAVLLAGLLTRHRGMFAVVVSCGVLAVYPDSALAARTVLLEPWLVLFCLLGALAVFDGDRFAGDRRLLLGGLAFGFAGAVKVWAILPVVVIVALLARKPRRAALYGAGVVAGFGLPVLPFILAAPANFYRDVITAQVVRSDVTRVPVGFRLQNMLGLTHVSQLATVPLVIIGAAVVVLIAAVTVAGSRLAHAGPPPLDWFATISCLLIVGAFLLPADFYDHYSAFLAPFLALSIALPVSRLLDALAPSRRRVAVLTRRYALPAAAAIVLAFVGLQAAGQSHLGAAFSMGELRDIQRLIPRGSCVVTDQVSYTIEINRFVSTNPRCSIMVDGVGSDYALSGGRNGMTGAGSVPAVQSLWLSAFKAAQYAWLTGDADRRIPWTPTLTDYFQQNFVPLNGGEGSVYVRKGAPGASP